MGKILFKTFLYAQKLVNRNCCVREFRYGIIQNEPSGIDSYRTTAADLYTTVCENCNTNKETCDRNEMYSLPQIRYMAIVKRLELQNCTWSVSMWFQYGVKPRRDAIRVSMRRSMESKRPWISSWRMSLHAVYIRVHKASRVGAGGPWPLSRRPTISQTYPMGDMSSEHAGQVSSDTRRL